MLEITVKTLDSQNHNFTVDDDITVRGFKDHIAETVAVAAESQRLIYYGRVLQDDKKLNDYDINGKVIHLVQRAPPQPESRSSNNDGQRQNNSVPVGRIYRSHVHPNAMYLSAMLPTEVVEGPGLPTPQLSNTLSNSRLVSARRMLNRTIQLMDRLDDPSVPLHSSPTESNASESGPPTSAPEETDQDSNVNGNINNTRNRMVQAASEIAAAFSAAALINIRLSRDNGENGGNVAGSVNVIDPSQMEQTAQASAQPMESEASEPQRSEPQTSEPKTSETSKSEKEKAEPGRSESARPETQRPEAERLGSQRADASTSNNNDNQNASRRSTPQVPRPPQMAELLERLVNTQDRLRPYIERYRVLMLADPSLTPGSGPEGVAENQRIVDGVSECLHYLSHACHALSDIIVDMGQQPPRNLRCRPIIIQHSAILQAGIPIQVESRVNLSAPNATNNNNTTDDGNEATRPSSPTSAASDQTSRSSNANNRSMTQTANGHQNQSSLLGTLLNLPSNVELTMELSPQSAMDLSSPNAADSTDNEQGQMGASGGLYSMSPPFALIRDALQSVLSERHSQMETSSGSSMNMPSNIPFVTIVGQQIDFGTPNSGQSTQARSNIGTHPTTSTQTRSTARPHVLHPHTHPLGMGMGMTQNMDFDPILPCHSHHIRRAPPATANSTSTFQSNQANQSTTSESRSRSQSASRSSTSARTVPQTVNMRDLENDGQTLGNGIDINIVGGDLHISLIGNMPNTSEVPLVEILRSFNPRIEEITEENFLIALWLFMLRNVTFGGLMQLGLGQSGPLVNLRRRLQEFLEHSFPDALQTTTLQDRVLEEIVTLSRPYLQALFVPEIETASRQIDIPATVEALLRTFSSEFLKLLFNNDFDNATFAQETVTLARKLEDQSSAVLRHILERRNISLDTIISRFVSQFIGEHPLLQQTVLGILSTRIRAFATRTTQMTQSEIASLLVYKNQPSAPPAESSEPIPSKPRVKTEIQPEDQAQAQALPLQSEQQQSLKKEIKKKDKLELKPELFLLAKQAMETDSLSDKKLDDPMDLNGEEIPETFPGAEHLPPEWVPIIARDSVIQRRQTQLQAQQGGPIPFSDAYLSGLPSKRRKLIEQQKPQLLVSPTANSTAITASVERLVREGIGHTQLEEAEGAAHAVAATPAVRNAFGQAIKDCLHPGRLRTPDFPNSARFPNASRLFADQNKEQKANTSATTANKSSK
ncbi:large proline-rich protein BAG6 isoform X2 [Nasonia vitripennis]|uniref:Large proline-rich protein BAG6 n=1 Tax=Nasonia vitripennis TaxID=7425 RepID=A0A7M7GIX3_NASVI|nr:large proline-rich protein BAG6 isoform X2 [Nasonia vitripennis]XP_016838270.1 large proline-rich protein BAG6 isoform X2 [Nasonia vitripennis]XP_032453016.1 large proline-rich protein BAG6 isoform X2 [Nasonia vitripennis]XP_032453017.1 large proline-rich protein BAG6 isoform X2 [Nasonia vitripennis]